jgi:1-deoxy-D-xylulose-5-phosphate reductoisomerase
MKCISLLGATGSIGKSTLDIVRTWPDKYKIYSLVANKNFTEMERLVTEFSPEVVVMNDPISAKELMKKIKTKVLTGNDGIKAATEPKKVDVVVAGIVGFDGLESILTAIDSGKNILLANKEAIICAGDLLIDHLNKTQSKIIPIDSEHNAVFQCLGKGYECFKKPNNVNKIILTASGGPFRDATLDEMKTATIAQALNHPNWKMGDKITIDSATMMNKGLEVLEAHWLFNLDNHEIGVLVHPESVVHSMVEFADRSTLAQLSSPDMRVPISYGLSWPSREKSNFGAVDWSTLSKLSFHEVDEKKFPAIKISREVLYEGNSAGMILNIANEVAVDAFLKGKVSFLKITDVIQDVLSSMADHFSYKIGNLEDLEELRKKVMSKAKAKVK